MRPVETIPRPDSTGADSTVDVAAIGRLEAQLDAVAHALEVLDAEGPDAAERLDVLSFAGAGASAASPIE